MNTMRALDGKIALVTGGGGGIGSAICRHYYRLVQRLHGFPDYAV